MNRYASLHWLRKLLSNSFAIWIFPFTVYFWPTLFERIYSSFPFSNRYAVENAAFVTKDFVQFRFELDYLFKLGD